MHMAMTLQAVALIEQSNGIQRAKDLAKHHADMAAQMVGIAFVLYSTASIGMCSTACGLSSRGVAFNVHHMSSVMCVHNLASDACLHDGVPVAILADQEPSSNAAGTRHSCTPWVVGNHPEGPEPQEVKWLFFYFVLHKDDA